MTDLTAADVDEIRRFLSDTRGDVLSWLPARWEPGWKSEAASELGNAEAGPNAPWGDRPVRTAYAEAQLFLYASLDSLAALGDSVNVMTTTYVPHVLARAAMEAGSQAWWLLEPKIGARRRVIRGILVRASSARYVGKAARKLDPVAGTATTYGEDQAKVRAYAADLGLTYVCNDSTYCETDVLPSYNQRAADFEKALFSKAAYAIYSGAAHAELYAVSQGWRISPQASDDDPLWERQPDRIAVWAAVISASGFAMIPAYRAITLLGKNARKKEFHDTIRNMGQMVRKMDLPREWIY